MKGFAYTVFAVLCVLAAGRPAVAETYYKWVDKDGVTHYSKDKPTDRESEETLVMRSEGQSAPVAPDPVSDEQRAQLPEQESAALTQADKDYAKARERAAACSYATGGLQIAQRFFQASLSQEESGAVGSTEKYREEAEQMRTMMSQNCEPAPAS